MTAPGNWKKPLKWNKEIGRRNCLRLADSMQNSDSLERARVFCASLSDVFEDWQGPIVNHKKEQLWYGAGHITTNRTEHCNSPLTMNDVRRSLFALIDATPNLDWLLLTKRPENIRRMWPQKASVKVSELGRPVFRKNVWLGTTVENAGVLPRIDSLKACGDLAPVLFLSCEPLLSGLPTLGEHLDGIDWVIAGGESGPKARPANPQWFRQIRDQCHGASVPFHFKQYGEWVDEFHPAASPRGQVTDDSFVEERTDVDYRGFYMHRVGKKKAGRLLDGVIHDAFPKVPH